MLFSNLIKCDVFWKMSIAIWKENFSPIISLRKQPWELTPHFYLRSQDCCRPPQDVFPIVFDFSCSKPLIERCFTLQMFSRIKALSSNLSTTKDRLNPERRKIWIILSTLRFTFVMTAIRGSSFVAATFILILLHDSQKTVSIPFFPNSVL